MDLSEEKRKRILIFSLAYAPFVGGAELAVKEITDRIDNADFDLITLRFDRKWPRKERLGNVNVYRIGGGKLFFPIFAFCKANRLHKKNPFDLVWSIMANRAGFAALFFKLRHPEVKYLLTLQEGDPVDHPFRQMGVLRYFLTRLYRKVFSKADCMQAISNYLAEWGRNMGVRAEVEVVPNGVDTKSIKSKVHKVHKVKDKNKKTIITTSRLVHKNGIDTLIRAVSKLKLQATSYKLQALILGAGPEEQKLKNLAKELQVEDVVRFLGHVGPEKIPDYLGQADIFVRPSRSEGLGSSFLEAMGAGLPVIGTRTGGIVDFIKDPEDVGPNVATGVFAKIDDPEDLAYKIRMLFINDELAGFISRNGKWLVENNYSWDSVAVRMREIFSKVA